jgi:uncharacterized protein YbcV (DUF1398 family)
MSQGVYNITNINNNAYIIDNTVTAIPNGNIIVFRSRNYKLNIDTVNNPFWIQTTNTGYNNANVYFNGIDNNGTDSGIITWRVQLNTPSILYYISQNNPTMTGTIYIYNEPIVCFLEGTKILTDIGYLPIQTLRKGYLIKTLKNNYVPIDTISYRDIDNPICEDRIKDKLYVCSNNEYPSVFEDLIITGCHSILVDSLTEEEREQTIDVLGQAFVTDNKYRLPACVDKRTKPYEKTGIFRIYHIALENDDYFMNYGIYANGLLVETASKRYLKEIATMEELL